MLRKEHLHEEEQHNAAVHLIYGSVPADESAPFAVCVAILCSSFPPIAAVLAAGVLKIVYYNFLVQLSNSDMQKCKFNLARCRVSDISGSPEAGSPEAG